MASPKTFSTCEKLREVFPFGVAQSYKAANKAFRLGFERPPVRPKVYKSNLKKSPKLDKPPNGILCEVPIDDGSIESDLVSQKVIKDIRAATQSTPPRPTGFDLRFDPNVPSTRQSETQRFLQEAYAHFEQFAPSTPNVPVLILNENSFGWYQDQLETLPNSNCRYQDLESWTDGVASLGAGVRTGQVCWSDNGPFAVLILGSLSPPKEHLWLLIHEGTHVLQHLLFGTAFGVASLPSWIPEGQAHLYQLALDEQFTLDAIQVARERNIKNLVNVSGLGPNASAVEWRNYLINIEDIRADDRKAYTLGPLITERLYSDFGEQAIMDWITASGTMPWRVAFENVFGQSVLSWYESSAIPYLTSQTQRQ
jgi:hypothetical protein